MRSRQRTKQGKKGAARLTLKILRQLSIVVTQLRCLLGDQLELARDLGERVARGHQVRRGRAQIAH
jgi:hypothetical protein